MARPSCGSSCRARACSAHVRGELLASARNERACCGALYSVRAPSQLETAAQTRLMDRKRVKLIRQLRSDRLRQDGNAEPRARKLRHDAQIRDFERDTRLELHRLTGEIKTRPNSGSARQSDQRLSAQRVE